MKKPVT